MIEKIEDKKSSEELLVQLDEFEDKVLEKVRQLGVQISEPVEDKPKKLLKQEIREPIQNKNPSETPKPENAKAAAGQNKHQDV